MERTASQEDPKTEAQTATGNSESVKMEDVGSNDHSPKQGLSTVDENVAMQDAVNMGIAAAQTGKGVARGSSEDLRKRNREVEASNEDSRKKACPEDGYITEASMKSSSTVPRDNKHRDADQQLLAYRDSVEVGSVASMRDDDGSLATRNTWKSAASLLSHQKQVADRREKDQQKYAAMSKDERREYNAKRRDKYHRQSRESRQKKRQRERNRYHEESVMSEAESQARQERRDKLQQERTRTKQAVAATAEL